MTGAELLCESLRDLGVECVFGLPGTQNIPLYEALRRSRLRSVVPTHELAASFMANGYYRASGRPAALLTIPGPGFTYALPGLAEARHDSAAVLHIVGQPPRGQRKFQFQELDQPRIAEALVKGVFHADEVDAIPSALAAALDLATGGEPGPVLLDCSEQALQAAAGASTRRVGRRREAALQLDDEAVAEAGTILASSRRPLIMAGQGCADAAAGLCELAELLRAPVVTTLSGRGLLPEDHPLALGFDFARGGPQALNELLLRADCVLVIGCKLTAAGTDCFRLALPADRAIHVDASAETLGATYASRLAVRDSAESFLEVILPALRRLRPPGATEWTGEELEGWRTRLRSPTQLAEPSFQGVQPKTAEAFFAAVRRALPRDGIVVTDSGLHQTLVRRHLEVRSVRGLITPSDFQSMGFGLPAAIGARLAAPKRAVVAVIGDGGFAMTGMELLTAVRERVALTLVVFNDGQLNRIRLQQLAQYGHSEGCLLLNPDFEAFATAVGVAYARCEGDPESVFRTAIERDGPTLVEVRLGDSPAIRVDRAKGLARGMARRTLRPETLRWLKGKLRSR